MMVVITGGPSVGKSTLLDKLKGKGYTVVPEQATAVIKEGIFVPWEDRDRFQREVLKRQLEAEAPYLTSPETVFIDRGIFDGEAYYLCDKIMPPPIFDNFDKTRYSKVLLLEHLGTFIEDGVRFEDLNFTIQITQVLETVYKTRGYMVKRIPEDTIFGRLNRALYAINETVEADLEGYE